MLGDFYFEFFDSTVFSLSKYPQAVQSREVQIVSVLLDQGADLNIKDRKGDSAIHQAVYSDSLDILSKLHDFGGDIEEKTKVKIFVNQIPKYLETM